MDELPGVRLGPVQDRPRRRPPAREVVSRIDSSTVALTGAGVFVLAMTAYALVVFPQFAPGQVLVVALCFLVVLGGLTLLLSPRIRRIRPRPTALSFVTGAALAIVLVVLAFTWLTTPGPIWVDYFAPEPLVRLARGDGFHQDAAFHVSLIQSIMSFGYPSTGQDGAPFVPYHALSHYVDALILAVTGLEPYDAYGLFFHFKVTIYLVAIVLFAWSLTRRRGPVAFAVVVLVFAPVLLGTWIGVGSHGLWLTSLILILSAGFVYDVIRTPRPGPARFAAVFLIGVAVGTGKVSSGLLFVALVGILLWLRGPRRWLPYALLASWLAFFLVYWRVFSTGEGSGLKRPTVRETLDFLNFTTTYGGNPIEWNLAAIYLVTGLLAVSFVVFRRALTGLLVIAILGAGAALTAITQLLAGLTQPDVFYFIYGLLIPVLLLGAHVLVDDVPRPVRLPRLREGWTAHVVRAAVVALMIAATIPMAKAEVNIFSLPTGAIGDSLHAANTGYFADHNRGRPADERISVVGVLTGEDVVDTAVGAEGTATEFRDGLDAFLTQQGLDARNALLFVPREEFEGSIAELGGPEWARGMLVYALTGIPLIHGISDPSIRNFGQSSYGVSAVQVDRDDFSAEEACSRGRQVIVVESWSPADFALACPPR